MHIFDGERRFMGGYGIVGGNLPLAAGLGARLRLHGHRRRHRLHVRRRRLEHRQLRRDDEPGGALEPAGRLHPREQPLRDGDRGRAPLRGHRLLEEGRGPRGARDPRRRHGRARDARDRRRAPADRPRGAPADDGRGVHLPLPRPLGGRPRGLPDQGGGRGVAQEGPDRDLRRPPRGRGGARATESARRCASGSRRGCSRRSSSPTPRPSLRSTRSTTTSTWSATRCRAGTRSTSGRRSRSPASASASELEGEAKKLAEAGAAYAGRAAETGRREEDEDGDRDEGEALEEHSDGRGRAEEDES